jgi:hypothetical protein
VACVLAVELFRAPVHPSDHATTQGAAAEAQHRPVTITVGELLLKLRTIGVAGDDNLPSWMQAYRIAPELSLEVITCVLVDAELKCTGCPWGPTRASGRGRNAGSRPANSSSAGPSPSAVETAGASATTAWTRSPQAGCASHRLNATVRQLIDDAPGKAAVAAQVTGLCLLKSRRPRLWLSGPPQRLAPSP